MRNPAVAAWTIGAALVAWTAAVLGLTLGSYARVNKLRLRGAEAAPPPQAAAPPRTAHMAGTKLVVTAVDGLRVQLDLAHPPSRAAHADVSSGRTLAWLVGGAWWGVGAAADGWLRLGAPPGHEAGAWPITGIASAAPPQQGTWEVFVFTRSP